MPKLSLIGQCPALALGSNIELLSRKSFHRYFKISTQEHEKQLGCTVWH